MTRRRSAARTTGAPGRQSSAAPGAPGATVASLPWWSVAVIAVAAIAAYLNALGHPFVFDDGLAIVDNETIRSLWASLAGGPAQYPTAGRPLVNASFALNYAIGGVSPWGYQATNLGVHILCALVLFALARQVLQLPRAPALLKAQAVGFATALALVWAVHPLTSEVVNYATQRSEALMALALLATLYCGTVAVSAERARWWYIVSVAACAAGMACKETMVVAPVLMLLLDATFTSGGVAAAVRRHPWYYLALLATEVLLVLLIMDGPRSKTAGFHSGVSPWVYLVDQAPLIVHYLRLVVWPVGLVFDYGETTVQALGEVWPAAAGLVVLLLAAVIAWFRVPAMAFLATWFFITLAPTSSLVPIATEVGAERRMYLPLVAVLAALLAATVRLLQNMGDARTRRLVATSAVCVAAVIGVSLTIVRNAEYETGVSIWQTVVERWPTGRAHYTLGRELRAVGRRDEAVAQYRLAVDTSPDASYALGFEAAADGRHQEAVDRYRTFLQLRPADGNVPLAYYNIGQSLKALGRHEEAVAAFRETLARQAAVTYKTPGMADSVRYATGGLADSLFALQRWNESVTTYADYLRIVPGDPAAEFGRGLALAKLDRHAEARDAFESVLKVQPTNVAAHVNLALALAQTGQVDAAVQHLRRAVQLEPDPAARQGLEREIASLLRTPR